MDVNQVVTYHKQDVTVIIYRQDEYKKVSVSETEHKGKITLISLFKKVIAPPVKAEQ